MDDAKYIRLAIDLAKKGMTAKKGGPFGAVIVNRDGEIVGKGNNMVTSTNDPTAHAEVVAIRDACNTLSHFQLEGCTIYSSCEPCPMCLGAIYWSRPDRIVFASSREDAAKAGFDDDFIYKEIPLPIDDRKIPTTQQLRDEGQQVFDEWKVLESKIDY
jgi:tRNA(Arg) A34 adenosine deaminase TadA